MEKEKKNKFTAFIAKHKIISTIISLIILFALTIAITSFAFDVATPKDVLIPDLVGLSLDEAKSKIEESKLSLQHFGILNLDLFALISLQFYL